MATKIVTCPSCGTQNTGLENFCRNCGTNLADPFQSQQDYQNQQMQQSYDQNVGSKEGADKKMLVGIVAIVGGILGLNFGLHKFLLGYQQAGIIMVCIYLGSILLTAITCGIGFPLLFVPMILGIIEGIIYLTKSDEEFVNTYIIGNKPWF